MLASGADDCCVLVWDLMGSAGTMNSNASSGMAVGGAGTGTGTGTNQERGPTAAWECGFEVSNVSWAPTGGTLGVCAGRGFWGVQL
jgi:DDB1- and CUL4-associated factor 7